jgi:hypothetical protein
VPDAEVTTTIGGATTSIVSTTTTKPPECKDLLPVSVVFVGTVIGTGGTQARFAVAQIREGELPATRVSVEYPDDIRFMKDGRQYLVTAAIDPETNELTSKVRPAPEQPDDDPCIERDLIYTRNLDGTNVDTGLFSGLAGKGWTVAWAFVLPTLIALGLLTVLVLFKRAGSGAFRLSLRGAATPRRPSPPPGQEPPAPSPDPAPSRTPASPGPRARP